MLFLVLVLDASCCAALLGELLQTLGEVGDEVTHRRLLLAQRSERQVEEGDAVYQGEDVHWMLQGLRLLAVILRISRSILETIMYPTSLKYFSMRMDAMNCVP